MRKFIAAAAIAASLVLLGCASSPAPAQQPATTTATVETSAPLMKTTVSVGDLGSQVLSWVLATFGTTIGGGLTLLIFRGLRYLGVKTTDAMRAKLQDMIVNGLNLAGDWAKQNMQGKGNVEIKDAIVARTVAYVQLHGAETMKKVGSDPLTQRGIEVIKARIETAIADPTVPTPAQITPPETMKISAAAA